MHAHALTRFENYQLELTVHCALLSFLAFDIFTPLMVRNLVSTSFFFLSYFLTSTWDKTQSFIYARRAYNH